MEKKKVAAPGLEKQRLTAVGTRCAAKVGTKLRRPAAAALSV